MKSAIESPIENIAQNSVKPRRIASRSNDYERFVSIEGNREINQSHVAKLVRSMEVQGNISVITCREVVRGGRKLLEIVDGQHRFEALKIRNEEIEFDCWGGINNRGMLALNENSKNWVLEDYLNFGIKDGIVDYISLKKYQDESGIALSTLIDLFSGYISNSNEGGRRVYKTDIFKGLSWRIKDKEKNEEILKMLLDFYRKFKCKLYSHIRFVQAFIVVANHPKYDHNKMLEQMALHGNLLTRQYSKNEYIQVFESIYNFGTKSTSHDLIFFKNPLEQ